MKRSALAISSGQQSNSSKDDDNLEKALAALQETFGERNNAPCPPCAGNTGLSEAFVVLCML